jgi:hypothetical protein
VGPLGGVFHVALAGGSQTFSHQMSVSRVLYLDGDGVRASASGCGA